MINFADNSLLPSLFGEYDRNLARIEQSLGVRLSSRGKKVSVAGSSEAAKFAEIALKSLYRRLERGLPVDAGEVDAAVRLASMEAAKAVADGSGESIEIRTPKRHVAPRSIGQAGYMRALSEAQMVFGVGPAGTGKTYLAVAMAAQMLISGKVDRIILSRPAVEAGERLGFFAGRPARKNRSVSGTTL